MRIVSWVLIHLTLFIFTLNRVDAQWIQSNGPERGKVNCFTTIDGDIFAGIRNTAIWHRSIADMMTTIGYHSTKAVKRFFHSQNYPNPFNPSTKINYELGMTNYVEPNIYNLLGQKVKTLVSEIQNAGSHQVEWDAYRFASGIYYFIISTPNFADVKKMVFLR